MKKIFLIFVCLAIPLMANADWTEEGESSPGSLLSVQWLAVTSSVTLPTGALSITGAGAGSGLDADLLDGQTGTYYQNASNITGSLTLTGLTINGNVAQGNGAYSTSLSSTNINGSLTISGAFSGTVDDIYLSTSVAHIDEAQTIIGNWVNTASPWADNEVSDTLTASDLVAGSSVVSNAEVDDDITLTNITQITTRAHDSLTGLTDDDHTIYFILDGSRAIAGNITQGSGVYSANLSSATINGTLTVSGKLDIGGIIEAGSGNIALTDATGNIDGEFVQNDTIDDDSIDFTDVTGADLTLTDCGNIGTSGTITYNDTSTQSTGFEGLVWVIPGDLYVTTGLGYCTLDYDVTLVTATVKIPNDGTATATGNTNFNIQVSTGADLAFYSIFNSTYSLQLISGNKNTGSNDFADSTIPAGATLRLDVGLIATGTAGGDPTIVRVKYKK